MDSHTLENVLKLGALLASLGLIVWAANAGSKR